MLDIKQPIKDFFEMCDSVQERLSERWREHSNRRTTIILILLGTLTIGTYVEVIRPPDTFPIEQLVTIPQGSSLSGIAQNLYNEGVIRSPLAFRVIVTLLGSQNALRAGDYLFKEPRDIFSVARIVVIGAYGLEPIEIRVPEGATTRQMAIIFGSRLQRFDRESFLSQAQPIEGYLFPDTYFFLPNAREDIVIQTLRQNFDAHLNATSTSNTTLATQIEKSGRSLDEIVIMASILEREANDRGDDRRRIAGVLWNRITRGMALQVDAAFLYTLGKGTFALTRKDLKTDGPYNTYTRKGLPPTAIGSPSMNSLIAAATPIKSNNLFYLADSDGVTHYSKTYQQHLIKKDAYIDN